MAEKGHAATLVELLQVMTESQVPWTPIGLVVDPSIFVVRWRCSGGFGAKKMCTYPFFFAAGRISAGIVLETMEVAITNACSQDLSKDPQLSLAEAMALVFEALNNSNITGVARCYE